MSGKTALNLIYDGVAKQVAAGENLEMSDLHFGRFYWLLSPEQTDNLKNGQDLSCHLGMETCLAMMLSLKIRQLSTRGNEPKSLKAMWRLLWTTLSPKCF